MRALAQTFTTHNKTHDAHAKLAHRREFAHAHAYPDKNHTHRDTQCTHTKTCTPQGVCACARAPRQTPHTSRHTLHIQKLAHRREFPHARAHGGTQETHNAHAKTCTPRSKCACVRTRRRLTRTKKNAKREARRTRIWPRGGWGSTRGGQTARSNPLARRLKNCTTQGI